MYIKYNGIIYEKITDVITGKEIITTYYKEKTDETFYKRWDYYAKEFNKDDKKIEDIYDVDFYVYYMDDSETLKKANVDGIWCVNEGRPLYRNPELEKNELGLILNKVTYSEDWVQFDGCTCGKIVDLYECGEYKIKYTYKYKDGKELQGEESVEVKMQAESFKEEMLKHRVSNV